MALVLIVDDSLSARKAICDAVEADNHKVLEAANGRKGLEMIAAHAPDCIVLDLIMPEVDGFEVLKTLQDQGVNIPVIILTSDIQEIVRKECLELGAAAFINKPPKMQELRERIRKVLDFKEEAYSDSTCKDMLYNQGITN